MAREKFIYNTQTLRYEKVREPLRYKILKVFGFVCVVLVTSILLVLTIGKYIPSPLEQKQARELDQMRHKFQSVNQQLIVMEKVLENIQERDASVHRMMFGMDPIDESVWQGGVGGHDPYSDLAIYDGTGEILRKTQERVEGLKRKIAMQSESLDTITSLARDRERMFASIPSIKPVRSDKLKRRINLLSGFGMRIHPIHKVPTFHKGIDFTSPSGTPVYATGDGTVVRVEYRKTGYGYNIIIDHGYGYQTLYAHLSKILVKKGEKITKGHMIGKVGNTGTSTAPHLHYEVHLNGRAVNPINHCLDDLSPEEYQMLVEMADTPNQSFD